MKNLFIFIILLIINELTFGQKNIVNPNGKNIFYYPNGQVSSEGLMKDEKPDGYWKTYHVNGKLKSEGNRKSLQLDSIWVFYNEKGDTIEKINYLYDKKNGFTYLYQTSLDTIRKNRYVAKEMYINDVKQGLSFYYYSDGKLKQTIEYKDGKKHGEGKEYDQNGVLITINSFHNDYNVDRELVNRKDELGRKQGKWIEFFKNGNVKSEFEYRNDKLNGYVKEFNEQGKIVSSVRFENGDKVEIKSGEEEKIEIINTYYEDNKTIKTSGAFKSGIPVGMHREYDQSGNLISSKLYDETGIFLGLGNIDKEGNKQGFWEFYFDTREIKSKGEYKNDKKIGKWNYFFKNGKLEQTGDFVNGQIDGKWLWFYENSDTLRIEHFKEGIEEGLMVEYSKDKQEITKGNFFDGAKEGFWFYHVGDEREEGNYTAGKRNGKWKHFYDNGKLMFEGEYVQGFPNGKHKFYYPNGKVKEEGSYVMGNKAKTWRKFDEDGTQYMTITYKYGVEIKIDGAKIK